MWQAEESVGLESKMGSAFVTSKAFPSAFACVLNMSVVVGRRLDANLFISLT